jgi:hypothetical protein
MKTKDKTLTLRMYAQDHSTLRALAAGDGVSMAQYIQRLIRKEAKKQGVPERDNPWKGVIGSHGLDKK